MIFLWKHGSFVLTTTIDNNTAFSAEQYFEPGNLETSIISPTWLAGVVTKMPYQVTLQWRHNGRDTVSNHLPHDCLLNRLFRRRSKKTSKLRVTGLCAGNSPGTGEFPAQMASNAENVCIWWRHHESLRLLHSKCSLINIAEFVALFIAGLEELFQSASTVSLHYNSVQYLLRNQFLPFVFVYFLLLPGITERLHIISLRPYLTDGCLHLLHDCGDTFQIRTWLNRSYVFAKTEMLTEKIMSGLSVPPSPGQHRP